MVKTGRRHTRLALKDLSTANAVYDTTTDATNLTLAFNNGESAILSLPTDESSYLGSIGNWLLLYRDRANIGTV